MFRKTTALAAAVATTATLALAAGPANALPPLADYPGGGTMPTPIYVDPTAPTVMEVGKDYESDDEYERCQDKLKAANGWLDSARQWEARGRPALAAQAEANADKIAGEANKAGCTLIQPE